MIELKGKYGIAKVFTDVIEDSAISQIIGLLNQSFIKDCKVRIMPDVCMGNGACVGFTANLGDKVIPNLVGVDIGCFTGDTKVKLADGRDLSFIELINEYDSGKINYCYSKDKEGKIAISRIDFPRKIKTVNKLLQITLDNKEVINCTVDHIFYKRDNSECEAKDLKVGDSLYPLYLNKCNDIQSNFKILNSFKSDLSNDTHLCVYQPNLQVYEFVHILSDEYNVRNNLINEDKLYDGKKSFVRHHIDFNKFNNNPTNIERVSYKKHWHVHYNSLKITNKLGISGFRAAIKLHPDLPSEAGKVGAKSTWDNSKNGIINRDKAKQRFIDLNKSDKQKEKSRQRQLENNSNKWNELNKNPEIKFKQKLSAITNICNKCIEIYGEINEYNFNLARKEICKNGIKFNTALNWCKQNNIDLYSLSTYKNHKIIDIKEINNINEDVYCLTNFEYGNFALSSGIFVHNCGVLTTPLGPVNIDYKRFDKILRENVAFGFEVNSKQKKKFDELEDMYCYKDVVKHQYDKVLKAIGSTGSGNHFVEIDEDFEGNKYLMIHCGSRHLGLDVCKYYQNKAGKEEDKNNINSLIAEMKASGRESEIQKTILEYKSKRDKIPNNLLYLIGKDKDEYLHDMRICQEYAALNRFTIAEELLKNYFNDCQVQLSTGGKLKIKQKGKYNIKTEWFDTIHNYIGDDNIIRKGAVSAYEGQKLIVPINMRDGALICMGKGNKDWNFSCPHGAGRILSRGKAKEILELSEYSQQMQGIYSTCINEDTIDEAPMAYKRIEDIINNIGDTVEIIKIIKPVYNFKASK